MRPEPQVDLLRSNVSAWGARDAEEARGRGESPATPHTTPSWRSCRYHRESHTWFCSQVSCSQCCYIVHILQHITFLWHSFNLSHNPEPVWTRPHWTRQYQWMVCTVTMTHHRWDTFSTPFHTSALTFILWFYTFLNIIQFYIAIWILRYFSILLYNLMKITLIPLERVSGNLQFISVIALLTKVLYIQTCG